MAYQRWAGILCINPLTPGLRVARIVRMGTCDAGMHSTIPLPRTLGAHLSHGLPGDARL